MIRCHRVLQFRPEANEFFEFGRQIIDSCKILVHTYDTLFVQRSVIKLFGTCTGFVQIAVFVIFVSVCFCKLLCLFCVGFVTALQRFVLWPGRVSNPPASTRIKSLLCKDLIFWKPSTTFNPTFNALPNPQFFCQIPRFFFVLAW